MTSRNEAFLVAIRVLAVINNRLEMTGKEKIEEIHQIIRKIFPTKSTR